MNKIKFGLIGTGWRADFFTRIAKEIPELFEVSAILCRDKDRGIKIQEDTGIDVYNDLDSMIFHCEMDFVVLCVAKSATPDYIIRLFKLGTPVLCETPPANNYKDLIKLYSEYIKYSGKIQIAEQYQFQPYYSTWMKVCEKGYIGEVTNINMSILHGYHAVSVMRRLLGTNYCNALISGKSFNFTVTETDSRDNIVKNGEVKEFQRDRITLEFQNGKTAFYDFSGVQYHSFIRSKHFNVQGTKGEIDDFTLKYINKDGDCITEKLDRCDLGVYNNNHWSNKSISICGQEMYTNPFTFARLNDDEIAMATCLKKMKEYVLGGKGFYSLEEGLQDAYLSLLMSECLNTEDKILTESQPWCQK